MCGIVGAVSGRHVKPIIVDAVEIGTGRKRLGSAQAGLLAPGSHQRMQSAGGFCHAVAAAGPVIEPQSARAAGRGMSTAADKYPCSTAVLTLGKITEAIDD